MAKYKSKLKRNSKFDPCSKRYWQHKGKNTVESILTCQEKIAYDNIHKARQAKKSIEETGKVMEIYRCHHCKKYHLTTG